MTDLFGEAVRDWMDGSPAPLLIERDDGYMDEQELGSYFASFDSFPACEKEALGLAKGRVLDIGLGPGRVSLHLQGIGLETVGVDISDHMLEVARRRGVRGAVRMSACDLRFPEEHFQTAVAFGNNFGLCGTPAGVIGMLVRLRKILSDEGVILAESINPVATNKPEHLRYQKENVDRGRMQGQITLRFKFEDLVSGWFDLLIVTPGQMEELCAKAGWKVDATYPSGADLSDANVYTSVLRKA